MKIVCLTPCFLDVAAVLAPEILASLARLKAAVGIHGQVEVIAVGPTPWGQDLGPGLRLRVLGAAVPRELLPDPLSWELPETITNCDIVHLLNPFCPIGEMGLLLAKLQGKPVCAARLKQGDSLGAALDLLSLADVVVRPDEPAEQIAAVYQGLLAGVGEAAA